MVNGCKNCGGPTDTGGACIRSCLRDKGLLPAPHEIFTSPVFRPLAPVCPQCYSDLIAMGRAKPGVLCERCKLTFRVLTAVTTV